MKTTIPTIQDSQQFAVLYKSRFGVESKPEHATLMAELHLTPEEGIQFIEDLISLIQQVFDAYFEELKTGQPLEYP